MLNHFVTTEPGEFEDSDGLLVPEFDYYVEMESGGVSDVVLIDSSNSTAAAGLQVEVACSVCLLVTLENPQLSGKALVTYLHLSSTMML